MNIILSIMISHWNEKLFSGWKCQFKPKSILANNLIIIIINDNIIIIVIDIISLKSLDMLNPTVWKQIKITLNSHIK